MRYETTCQGPWDSMRPLANRISLFFNLWPERSCPSKHSLLTPFHGWSQACQTRWLLHVTMQSRTAREVPSAAQALVRLV